MNWQKILKEWTDLPKIPQKPVVEQINPAPYGPRIEYGKLKPPSDDDDGKKGKKKKAEKKAAPKKGEKAAVPTKWADGPPT
jgi:hypothetical protein